MITNSAILLIAYLISIWFFRRWIKSGSFKNATLTPQRMRTIAIRTALLYIFLGWLSLYCQMNALKLMVMIALWSLALFAVGGSLTVGWLAGAPIIIYYVLFQWLLGFPDRDCWIPPNQKYEYPEKQPFHLIGKNGQVESTLRPIGEVLIDGQKHIATSEIDFIEKGTSVTVVAIKNSNLVVRAVEE